MTPLGFLSGCDRRTHGVADRGARSCWKDRDAQDTYEAGLQEPVARGARRYNDCEGHLRGLTTKPQTRSHYRRPCPTRCHFTHVVEGPAVAIDALMARVAADPRHDDIVILGKGPAPGRLFEAWVMAIPDRTPLKEQSFRIINETGTGAQVVSVLLELTKRPGSLYGIL